MEQKYDRMGKGERKKTGRWQRKRQLGVGVGPPSNDKDIKQKVQLRSWVPTGPAAVAAAST